ncbi:LacI family DNA-binding transcriptional regulator [Puia sp.]|jgi:LacI family transcriptional regulator|uniref:LacI family DNA-binding transcriptional regulator n=1 Tax=Puia sp. TaxID=2045100 RepID=UPI002F429590
MTSPNHKDVNIYDIARILNVSTATVSRALKNNPAVSKATRKKVLQAAKKMGYRPNNHASSLRSQKTNTIGIIIHELNSNFIISVLTGIEKVTAEAGYDIIIAHSSETAAKEKANAHNLFYKRVDGLIVSLAYDTEDLSHFDPFIRKGIPVVYFDRVEEEALGVKIVIDNVKAGAMATEHLINQGCRDIVHLTGNLRRNVYADRLAGYRQALLANGQPYREDHVIINDLSTEAAVAAGKQILEMQPRPDGLFVTNDFCASVCMQVLKEGGMRIPQDIAVVGFNNDIISTIVEPRLTTVSYPGKEIGEVAARHLIGQLKAGRKLSSASKVILSSKLLVRASSQRLPS